MTLKIAVAFALMTGAVAAKADITGPTPLAWRWTQSTLAAPIGSPLVMGNEIYLALGQRVYCLDKTTGNKRWQFPQIEPISGYFRNAKPVMVGQTLVASADNKSVYGINPANGQRKWEHFSLVQIIGQPVAVGKYVVIALSDNTINALDSETGDSIWSEPFKVEDGIMNNMAGTENSVIFFTNTTYDIRSLNITTKKINWSRRFGFLLPETAPIMFGENIYVASSSYVTALTASSGRPLWNTNLGEQIIFSPAVTSNGVMVVTNEGKAYVLDVNGRRTSRQAIALDSMPAATPTSVGTMYVIPTLNGALNLVDPKTTEVTWSYLIRPLAGAQTQVQPNAQATPGMPQPSTRVVSTVRPAGSVVLADNTMLVLAEDGSLLAFDNKLGVDMTAPSVQMYWPNAGDQISGQPPLDLIFKVEDEATGINPKSLVIDFNGTPAEYEYTSDGVAVIRISAVGKNKPFRDGRLVITVTVADWMGNVRKESFTLSIDNSLRPVVRPGSENPNRRPNQ